MFSTPPPRSHSASGGRTINRSGIEDNALRLNALANAIREDLLSTEGVKKIVLNRRAAAVFSVGTPANHLYFLDAGLVKIERVTDGNKEILLSVVAPGEIFGEQALNG